MRIHRWKDEDYEGLRAFFTLYGSPESREKGDRTWEEERELLSGHVELNGNRKHRFCFAEVQLDGEEDVQVAVAIPYLFAVWAGLDLKRWGLGWDSRNPLRYLFVRGRPEHVGGGGIRPGLLGYGEREFGVRVRSGRLEVYAGVDPHGGESNRLYARRRNPVEWFRGVRETGQLRRPGEVQRERPEKGSLRWKLLRYRGWLPERGFRVRIRLDIHNLVLGRPRRLSVEDVTQERWRNRAGFRWGGDPPRPYVEIMVPMPEGNYPASVTLERSTWGRKRWPWGRKVQYSTDLEIPGGIPHPGKGENSWDCGDDGLYSIYAPVRQGVQGLGDPQLAAIDAAQSVLMSRVKYGRGFDYVPSEGWPDHMVPRVPAT